MNSEVRKTVGFIGFPNTGKTTIFNHFGGCDACVGNWTGVTASCQKAASSNQITYLDLPGCYYLPAPSSKNQYTASIQSVHNALFKEKIDVWVHVIDARYLKQQLSMTLSLIELNKNIVIALNHMDQAKTGQIEIDINKLANILNLPVVGLSAKFGIGTRELTKTITKQLDNAHVTDFVTRYPPILESLIQTQSNQQATSRFYTISDLVHKSQQNSLPAFMLQDGMDKLLQNCQHGLLELIIQIKRAQARDIARACIHKASIKSRALSKLFDRILLHRWLGLPSFFGLMFAVFWLSMLFGQSLQALLEPVWQLCLVDIPSWLLVRMHMPVWLTILLTKGVGMGVVSATSFLPVLFCVFVSLFYLEESGYMSRAAVVIDRLMRFIDLPGESLVALILGLGCNVPGILATKHIAKEKDRIATALMMPFISCSARLSIFAAFCGMLSPQSSAKVLFFLYLSGIAVAIFTGFALKKLYLHEQEEETTYLLELPSYQMPSFTQALKQGMSRSTRFVYQALWPIIIVCMVLTLLNHVDMNMHFTVEPAKDSALVYVGKALTYIFSPLGIRPDQWPLVVALITGLLAKEVVISTLGVFYLAESMHHTLSWYASRPLVSVVLHGFFNISEGLEQCLSMLNIQLVGQQESWLSAQNTGFISEDYLISYLLFTLLYFPCVSTLYAIAREVGWAWAKVSLVWSCVSAYIIAMCYLWISIYCPVVKYMLTNIIIWGATLCVVSLLILQLINFLSQDKEGEGLTHTP